MTKYQLEEKKSQESLVDGRGMWHRPCRRTTKKRTPHRSDRPSTVRGQGASYSTKQSMSLYDKDMSLSYTIEMILFSGEVVKVENMNDECTVITNVALPRRPKCTDDRSVLTDFEY